MKKKIIGMAILFMVCLLLSIFFSYKFINRESQKITVEMEKPYLPTIQFSCENREINTLYGYINEMNFNSVVERYLPISEERIIRGNIVSPNLKLSKMKLEIRNIDGSRLIEKVDINLLADENGKYNFEAKIEDLIEKGEEYLLEISVETSFKTPIFYYTKILYKETDLTKKQIDFLEEFHKKTFDFTQKEYLQNYLETDGTMGNKDLSYVNIHSSAEQVMYQGLKFNTANKPRINITYLCDGYGAYTLEYYATNIENNQEIMYAVKEKYLIKTINEKNYLMDFERNMDSVFYIDKDKINENIIDLGITYGEVDLYESEDAMMTAFVKNDSLFLYNDNENEFKTIYQSNIGYESEKNLLNTQQKIKVLSLDESGAMYFIVYGYIKSGKHEGKTGTVLYSYNGKENYIMEVAMFPSVENSSVVISDIEKLSFINTNRQFYYMNAGAIIEYDIEKGENNLYINRSAEEEIFISKEQKNVTISTENGFIFYDLQSGNTREVESEVPAEIAIPLAFVGEDFVYGIAKKSEFSIMQDMEKAYQMYKIVIVDNRGKIKKTHIDEGRIQGILVEENQIKLNRTTYDGSQYIPAKSDFIVSNSSVDYTINTVKKVDDEKLQRLKKVYLKYKIDKETLTILNTTQLLTDSVISDKFDMQEVDYKYTYTPWEAIGGSDNSNEMLQKATQKDGFVRDEKGSYLWRKAEKTPINQILAITEEDIDKSKSNLAICLDTMLKQVGNSTETTPLIEAGYSVFEIMNTGMGEYKPIEVSGLALEDLLYYVNQDIPVMVVLESGEPMLIVGYNQFNIVLFDPAKKSIYKKAMTESSNWLKNEAYKIFTFYKVTTN